jgi:hypothetical protein
MINKNKRVIHRPLSEQIMKIDVSHEVSRDSSKFAYKNMFAEIENSGFCNAPPSRKNQHRRIKRKSTPEYSTR